MNPHCEDGKDLIAHLYRLIYVQFTPRPGWMDVAGGERVTTKRLENAKNVLSNAVFGEGKEMSGSNPENRIWVAGKF